MERGSDPSASTPQRKNATARRIRMQASSDSTTTTDEADHDFCPKSILNYDNDEAPDYDNDDDDNNSLQDAVAVSSALVGEAVMDSPQGPPRVVATLPQASFLKTPDLMNDNRSQQKSSKIPTPPPLTTENANAMSVGIMAQGLAWVRGQRDRRKRLYLQNQAEQQLLKIRAAEKAVDQPGSGRTLMDNPTFKNLIFGSQQPADAKSPDPETIEQQDSNDDKNNDLDASTSISKSGDGISVALAAYATRQEEDEEWIPPVRVVEDAGDQTTNPFLLTADQMQQIAVHVLPRGIVYCRWKRLYSLARDGDSFDLCLRLIEDHARTLLVVRTSRNAVLGGYADSTWDATHGATYYGGANAALFKVDKASGRIRYYKWTGANRYVQLCDVNHKMLAFGGGGDDGAFGLCVEQDFQVGSTGNCATFDNGPLCDQENFEIVDMEIFGFLVGQF